jgi:hypothetical protein
VRNQIQNRNEPADLGRSLEQLILKTLLALPVSDTTIFVYGPERVVGNSYLKKA